MIIYGSGKTGRIHRNVQPDYKAEAREGRKTCKECGKVLPVSEFSKCKKMKSGRSNTCKKCVAKQERIRQRKREQHIRRLEQAPTEGSKVCKECGVEKPYSEFNRHSNYKDRHENRCKQCRAAMVRERRRRMKVQA
jgi:hypothetical protein